MFQIPLLILALLCGNPKQTGSNSGPIFTTLDGGGDTGHIPPTPPPPPPPTHQ